MKILKHEQKPIETRKKPRRPPPDPNSIEQRCKREGVKLHPSTIRNRMKDHNLTFEEAVAYKPTPRSKCGRIGKEKSVWALTTPGSTAEYQQRQGRKARFGEEPEKE